MIQYTLLLNGVLGAPYSQTLQGLQGLPPYTWALTAGQLPTGLHPNPSTGEILGTPTALGAFPFTMQVTDSTGRMSTMAFSVSVTSGFSITSPSLLNALNGIPGYSQTLGASGGTPPYTWSITAGSLPPGIGLDSSTGIISGQASSAGVYGVSFQAKDSTALLASQAFSLEVDQPIACSACNPPTAIIGQPYSYALHASGATPPYSWTPSNDTGFGVPGLTVSASGVISGTPTTVGTFVASVDVASSGSANGGIYGNTCCDGEFQVVIFSPFTVTTPLAITNASFPSGFVGVPYARPTLTSSGGPGGTPVWSLLSGNLPPGLTVANFGFAGSDIQGTPTALGTYNFVLQVTEGAAAASMGFSITILNPLRITPTFLPKGTLGVLYSQALSASGGVPPYVWTQNSGSPPPGLLFYVASATISGTPTQVGSFTVTFGVTDSGGNVTSQALTIFVDSDAALQFYPIPPCRIADTRASQPFTGALGPPSLAAGASRDFPVLSSACSIPSAAQAYSLNFTVVPEGPLGFLSVWPAGSGYPGVSTLNSTDGSIIANAAIVPAGTGIGGGITVLASNPTDLIIDINGYFAPPGASGLEFFPLTPCRVADTRSSQPFSGAFGPPGLSANMTRDFPVSTSTCLSGSEQAYSLNLTVVPSEPLEFLSTWPVGLPYPGVSTLNSPAGSVLANAAIVPAGTNGDIDVLAAGNTDLIIDINGKFAAQGSTSLRFYPVTPCRVADTRSSQPFTGAFGPPSLGTYTTRNFPIQSSPCGIPLAAQAYALNLTAVPLGPLGFLSAWPAGESYPGVSTLNSYNGYVIANAATVPAGTGGAITVIAGNPTDLIIDIVGYFAP